MPGLTTPRALVVDDAAENRMLVSALLIQQGFAVDQAADGEAAVRAASAGDLDLIVLDVGLPDIDGIEVAAKLTAADRERAVILTSSRDATDYLALVPPSGARGFIPKHELSGAAIAALAA